MKQSIQKNTHTNNFITLLLFSTLFIAGVLNSQQYLIFMGLERLYSALLLLFYILLAILLMSTTINFLHLKKRKINFKYILYFGLLFVAVTLKFILLFYQFPSLFLPGERLFSELITYFSYLLIIVVIINNIKSFKHVKLTVWFLGIGLALSTLIPLIFFPEMIGTRISEINGYNFVGAFWNASVISYFSIGWLLFALSTTEYLKVKKFFLLGMFLLIIFGTLAGLSRASFISLILSLFTYLIITNKFKSYIKIILSTVIIILFIIKVFPEAFDSFEQRLDGGFNIEDESRVVIWDDYLEDISDYFLVGEIQGDYRKYSITGHGPHSVYLNWFSQFGILGVLGFLLLIYGMISSLIMIKNRIPKQVFGALFSWIVAYLSIASINETGYMHLSLFCAFGIFFAWTNQFQKNIVHK